jgi:hypothetical protein
MSELIVTDFPRTIKKSHTCPDGRTFTYTVTVLTTNCYLLEADHTHAVNQYGSWTAYNNAWNRLTAHLDAKYPARTGNDLTRRAQETARQFSVPLTGNYIEGGFRAAYDAWLAKAVR